MLITITNAPFVDAGVAQTNCVDNLDFQLDATVSGASSTGIWSSTGTGTFDPNNTTIDAIYHASSVDSLNGGATLILTSTNIGNCNIVLDSIQINILPAGLVDAGGDQILCSNNAQVQLNGSITGGASEGIWSTSGSGIFLPNDTALNAIYIPSSADTTTGLVTLALTATNSCNFAMDIITINFTSAPTADAGLDQIVCANNPIVSLSGSVTVSAGGVWSTSGTGTFAPNNTSLIATYQPSPVDMSNGVVTIVLTTTGNGGCNSVTDTVEILIGPAPSVNAGGDQTICSSGISTQLQGVVTGGTTEGVWTSLGSGTFSPNDSTLNAEYIFSSADTTAGFVQLVLTSVNNGSCIAVTDTMILTFGANAFSNAGIDYLICASNLDVTISGFVSGGASTGQWTSLGTGTFFPNDSSLNAIYTCSSADSLNGSVQIVLTTTNNGGCQAGIDTMNIDIEYIPVVNAGPDQSICLGTNTITLIGTVNYASGWIWTTTGTGSFIPSDTSLSVAYQVSAADSLIGQVSFTLTSTGSSVCSSVSDDIVVNMTIPLSPAITYSIACKDNVINFFDNTTVNAGTITDWEWDFGNGNIYNAEDTMFTFSNVGYNVINYTVTSSLGCSYTITDSIYVNPLPIVNFNATTVCYKDSVQFTDLTTVSGGTIVDWDWDFDDGNSSTVQNPIHIYNINDDYEIVLSVISNEGCSATDTISFTVYPLPVADFGYTYDCANYTVSFIDSSSSQGNSLNFWNWSFGDSNTDNIQNPVNTYDNLGDYTVQLITGSSVNCSDTTSQAISIYTINVGFAYTEMCVYDTIYFVDNSTTDGGAITNWNWYFGDTETSTNQNPNHLYIYDGSYNVSLVIQSAEGCTDSIAYQVDVYPTPLAGFTINADDYKINSIISFIDASTGAINYNWDFGDNAGTSTTQNPTYSYGEEGTYEVIQIVENEYNCIDTAIQSVIIIGIDEVYAPVLPTGFTPNGDGINDTLYVRGGPFTEIVFRVYNEWGEMIFESIEPDIGWDGNRKGTMQPMGVYVYTVKAISDEGKEYSHSGEITLIR